LSEWFLQLKYGTYYEGFLYTCSPKFIAAFKHQIALEFFERFVLSSSAPLSASLIESPNRGGTMVFWVVETLGALVKDQIQAVIEEIHVRSRPALPSALANVISRRCSLASLATSPSLRSSSSTGRRSKA
jgi:hypothetical protein